MEAAKLGIQDFVAGLVFRTYPVQLQNIEVASSKEQSNL